MKKIRVWHLKKGEDRRFKQGHPWAYSNEILEGIEGVEPGEPVEVRDPSGEFLARGFANPASLIRFRTISRTKDEVDFLEKTGLKRRLERALNYRKNLGFAGSSFRWVFGEADELPGLLLDSYATDEGNVWVLQAQTAGMDRALPTLVEALEDFADPKTKILIKNDSSARKMEGLEEEKPRWVRGEGSGLVEAALVSDTNEEPIRLEFDIVGGQKTGLFLDQWSNIQLLKSHLRRSKKTGLKVLDLCSYVGHWSAQLAATGLVSEIDLVDASRTALGYAERNVKQNAKGSVTVRTHKIDVFEDLAKIKESYDVVIADPPALAKSRKSLPAAQNAYTKLNAESLRLLKEGGWLVSCSCSRLMTRDLFLESIAKAARKSAVSIRQFAEGSVSPDHPTRPNFIEGHYLKAFFFERE